MKKALSRVLRFLSSYELSCILFILLFALTYFGTVMQVEQGLYQAQKNYFESFFVVHYLMGAVPLPLPGAYPVMALLFVNLLLGGVIRARKDWTKLGILVAHIGILVLLGGAFFTHRFTESGHLMLNEGGQASSFESYDGWEIGIAEVTDNQPGLEHVIAPELFKGLTRRSQEFKFERLPFTLTLSGYRPNAEVLQKDVLQGLPPEKSPEFNRPGLFVTAAFPGGALQQGTLWAGAKQPLQFTEQGKKWRAVIRKRSYPLPFSIKLDKFTRELHPRTNMPKEFRSDITCTQDGMSEATRITMNEPMRRGGYTFYQSSWGPQNAAPGDPLYSVLAVVRNPADQYPLVACVIITAGLLLHFAHKLYRYLKSEAGRAS